MLPSWLVDALAASPAEVGSALLALPEDQWFDRKSARISPRQLADAEIGFANAEGGVIVVGLAGGRVEGTDAAPGHRNALLQAAIDFTVPAVRTSHQLVSCVNAS